MTSELDLTLHIWNQGLNLPTVNFQCLAVLAYCKFTQAPVQVLCSNCPWKSPSGELPFLVNRNGGSLASVDEIFNFMRQKGFNADHTLSSKQSADIIAYSSLLDEKLVPALLQIMWLDSKNYVDITRPYLSRQLPLWYRPYYLHTRYQQADDRTRTVAPQLSDTDRETLILKQAKECLNLLSARLGDSEYFFGKQPSSLDALVFGHIALLLRLPLSNTALLTHVKACPNLVQFCQRIFDKYFPQTEADQAAARQREEQERNKGQSEEFPHATRNTIIGVAVAVVAMVTYALVSGLVQVEISRDNEESGAVKDDDED